MAPEVFEIAKNEIDSAAVQLPLKLRTPSKQTCTVSLLLCYEMLNWEQPFEGEKMGDLFKRITVDRLRPELPDEYPSRVGFLATKVFGNTHPRERPNLPESCRELRYIKGLLLKA
jgi:hypothetical protein